jgi:hypothetical protein
VKVLVNNRVIIGTILRLNIWYMVEGHLMVYDLWFMVDV